ncbi:glucose 1-dehydrogenase [Peribacillus frigoritolerans]|uniref:SDR family NAD(P)-dependent oxidoreductase n=1 Tax=Peribacillus frigoritolerans TaxID=450367 RepID=UPI0021CF95D5|nr:glucose 1-dehydrogenase [Peribacillus frigoritolerans]MCU6598951.1 glucose 1-dehydrogenase [Peribacillus frigoritolerans]
MTKLDGKVSIITGGSSGIGEATVRQFAKEGAKIVIADINANKGLLLEEELKASGQEVVFVETDITEEKQIVHLITRTVSDFGRLDILFNNAGVGRQSESHQLELADWRKVLSVNLDGVFLMAKHAIKQMLINGGGSIVNTASIMGHVGIADLASYNASKHAVVGLTKSLSLSYAKDLIRVNVVCPGYIDTPLIDKNSEESKKQLVSLHPLGRLGRPDEIAKAVVFLASDDASFISGSSLIVDGGYTAQ